MIAQVMELQVLDEFVIVLLAARASTRGGNRDGAPSRLPTEGSIDMNT